MPPPNRSGAPWPEAHALLAALQAAPQAELSRKILACPCPPLVRAGLLLWNDDWSQAHGIVDSMPGATAAHWHAIAHRHEPDVANSKYWLGQAGDSPIYPVLAHAARQAGRAELVLRGERWDPYRFADCYAQPAQADWTRPLDRLEIRTLLERCLNEA